MEGSRSCFVLSPRANARLDQLRSHYETKYGLTLSASAVVRRAIDALFTELGLPGTPNDRH